jgi:hypothetical protein
MKGHIRERSPGHWAIILDQRDPPPAKETQMALVRRHQTRGTSLKTEERSRCIQRLRVAANGHRFRGDREAAGAFGVLSIADHPADIAAGRAAQGSYSTRRLRHGGLTMTSHGDGGIDQPDLYK